MVLSSFAALGVFSLTEFSKTQHFSLQQKTKERILEQGLYHFTSKEAAHQIVEGGYFNPTKGIVKNHFGKEKVYMFAGMPNFEDFAKNLPNNINPYISGNLEFNVVRVRPNPRELAHFKERMQDEAVVYEGRYAIGKDRGEAIELVVDLDEQGKLKFREKTEEEIENGYVPKRELLDILEKSKQGVIDGSARLLGVEVKRGLSSIPKSLPKYYNEYKTKRERKIAKENFQGYEFGIQYDDGKSYNVVCNELDFIGDKKLAKVNIQKKLQDSDDVQNIECYVDGHILALGEQAAAIYIQKVDEQIKNNNLRTINGRYYAGKPVFDEKNNEIGIGIKKGFVEYIEERGRANEAGLRKGKYADILAQKKKQYSRRHPIQTFIQRLRGQDIKSLPSVDDIGKYTNEKLQDYSVKDLDKNNSQDKSFVAEKEYNIKYKDASGYTVVMGDTVEVNGKTLRKLMISEDGNLLVDKYDATAQMVRNCYIDDIDFSNVDKKDMAKFLSGLMYTNKDKATLIEADGFTGTYVGGAILSKNGKKIKSVYNQRDNLTTKEGGKIVVSNKQGNYLDELSDLVYSQNEQRNITTRDSNVRSREDLDKTI